MQLTKYHVVPADGGWRVVSTLGRTRFDGQVLSWSEACRLRERLVMRQAQVYGDGPSLHPAEVLSDWPADGLDVPATAARRSTH